MAFIPIPVFIRRQEDEMPYFPKSEYERQKEYEERKKAERIERKRLERKALAKREKVKSRKIKKINKQVSKNGFTVSNFRAIYDYSVEQTLTGRKLRKIKKIHDEMRKYVIFTSDLDIYAQEESLREQNKSSNSKVDVSMNIPTYSNNKRESNHSLEELRILRDVLTNTSNNYEQPCGPILVKKR